MHFEKAPTDNAPNQCAGKSDPADRAGNPVDAFTQDVAAETEQGRPDNSTRRVECEKTHWWKPVHPREQRRESPQKRDEASEKDDLPAMTVKQILPELQPFLVQPDM